MLRSRKFWPIMLILAGIGLFAMPSSAEAVFRLRLAIPGGAGPQTGVVISDNGPGDSSPLVGHITFAGPVGANFIVNVTSGTSQPPLPGGNAFATLNLISLNIAAFGAGSMEIWLEKGGPGDGYTGGPDGPLQLIGKVGGVLLGPPGSTLAVQSWVNPSNLVPILGPDVHPAGPVLPGPILVPGGSVGAWPGAGITFTPGSFDSTSTAGFVKSGPYSLFARTVVTFTGAGNVSYAETQEVVPAPAGLVLAITAAPFLGIGYLRRRRALAKA